MGVPLSTTFVTWTRPVFGEPDEPPTSVDTIATGVRAHLSTPNGQERLVGGDEGTIDKRLDCDPVVDVDRTCRVLDETEGVLYEVVWVDQRVGLGLDHTTAGLRVIEGRAL